jgi:hypothetical protein
LLLGLNYLLIALEVFDLLLLAQLFDLLFLARLGLFLFDLFDLVGGRARIASHKPEAQRYTKKGEQV